MKKSTLSILLFLSLLPLAGCEKTNPPSQTETPTVSATEAKAEKILYIDNYPLTAYYQYELLDLSDLVVASLTYVNDKPVGEKEIITDYRITDEEKNIIQDKKRLTETGSYNYTISKEGYTSCTLSIEVYPSTDFKQTLGITSYPKTGYKIGETFSPDGLLMTLKTHRKTEEGTKDIAVAVTDYTRTIDGEDANNYVFSDYKMHTLKITVDGYAGPISVNISLSATSKNNEFAKNSYSDDSVSWKDSTSKMKLSISSVKEENGTQSTKTLYTSDEVKLKYTRADYSQANIYNWHYMPSKGNVPLLVIPIVMPGYENDATNKTWERINTCFFGDSSDTTFESLRSYYYKSSFGQLNLTGGVTGYVNASELAPSRNTENISSDDTAKLADLAYSWARKTYHLNAKDFDTDQDGTIDGRWIIYLHDIDSNSNYWGFTSTTGKVGTKDNPCVNSYGWAGTQFLDDYCYTYQHQDINDAHVIIHETGHRLGLTDYYSYGKQSYSPLGGKDRMDNNVFDHNPYSKRLLGWVTPNVVTGSVDDRSLYTSSHKEDSRVVIPSDDYIPEIDSDRKLLFNPFDEYLVIDCFANRNRNTEGWDIYQRTPLNGQGGRVFHVDSRLMDSNTKKLTDDPSSLFTLQETITGLKEQPHALRPISNTESGERAEHNYGLPKCADAYDEIRLISGWGYGNRYYDMPLSQTHTQSLYDLFKKNQSFSLSSFPNQFNGNAFDSGAKCSYQVTFLQVPEE